MPDNATHQKFATSSNHRRPRRRPAHLRTKTGCLTCRKRKKKCDETLAQCLNCAKQKLPCVWPFSTGTTGQSQHQDQPQPISPSRQIAISRWRWSNSSFPSSVPHLPWTYSPAITPDSGPLFDFLRSTFLPQLIRPATDGTVTHGLNRETMILALGHPFCMHALLACCGAEMPTSADSFRQLARFHYTSAVAGLRDILNDAHLVRRWVVAMLTIMMLCIYERAKPKGSPGVEVHLIGAAKLIAFYSVDSNSGANPNRDYDNDSDEDGDSPSKQEGAMHRLVRESFIFHVATSLPFQESDAQPAEIETALSLAEQAISQHFRPNTLSHSDSPVLGFPPQLFRCIYKVYGLYRSSASQGVSMETRGELDRDLWQWDQRIKTYARGLVEENASTKMNRDRDGLQTTAAPLPPAEKLNGPCLGPMLYILGSRLLLRHMRGLEQVQLTPTIDQLLPEGMDMVRQLQPDEDYYADYYCWPLLAIGMHLKSAPDRELLLRQVWAFWTATNNGTMRRLADMLDFLWR